MGVVHILDGAVIGSGCNICDRSYIESGAQIGNDVVIKNGVSIWRGITLEDRAFVGPNVAFTNDIYPHAKLYRTDYEKTLIREGASIGANATLLGGITIGRYSMIGVGAVVTHDVPDFALMYGNPARQHGWVCICGEPLLLAAESLITCPVCTREYTLYLGCLQQSG